MKVLLKITIGNKQYGIIKNNENNANAYINKLTESLRAKDMLVSMRSNGGHGTYHYQLKHGYMILTKQQVNDSVRYILVIHSNDENGTKSYASSSFTALKSKVYNELDSLGYDADPVEDVYGRWSISDNGHNISFTIKVVNGNSQHSLNYFDPLKAISIKPNFASLPMLGEPGNIPSRWRIFSNKNMRAWAIVAWLSCITMGFFGQLLVLFITNEYIKGIVRNYQSSYAIKEHLLRFWRYQMNAATLALAMQFLLVLIITTLSRGVLLQGYAIPNIIGFLLWILIDAIAFSRIKKKIDNLDY